MFGTNPYESPNLSYRDCNFDTIQDGKLQCLFNAWGPPAFEHVPLLQTMLRSDPSRRPSLPHLLSHKWVRSALGSSSEANDKEGDGSCGGHRDK